MDSSSSRQEQEQRKQAEIRKQIAILQSQLVDIPSTPLPAPPSPKRRRPEETCLAPATPSPKKRKLDDKVHASRSKQTGRPSESRHGLHTSLPRSGSSKRPQQGVSPTSLPLKPAPSNVLAKLASLNNQSNGISPMDNITRSLAFAEKAVAHPNLDADTSIRPDEIDAPKRDDRLALIEDLEVGPADHKPPFDDPHFQQLEPNSGIRLSSRTVPHDDVQEYLTGRFYLSPSRLYSTVRLLPNKQAYDVPVSGDWVTIAVVAERGPVKFSKAPVGIGREDEGDIDNEGSNELVGDGNGRVSFEDRKTAKAKPKNSVPHKPSGKKYVNIKLVDFGARSRSSSSATGGTAVIRGDAFLSLLLFESDGYDKVTKDGGRVEKLYKGGSRGAFEAMSKLKEGDVVALLNPKILKPFQRSTDKPHPTSNILAVTPESATSMVVLGRAKDLGMCQVVKRDGEVCGGWCDKRVSEVCEWHVQNAVERRRAGRAEFSIGTSGMSMSSAPKRKPAYDPVRQWGLKPEPLTTGADSTTYVVSGHVIGSSTGDSRSLHVAETMGREGQAKAKRKFGRDADRELKILLERDKEGMKAVVRAREVAKMMDEKEGGRGRGKGKEIKKRHKRNEGAKRSERTCSEEQEDSDLNMAEDHTTANKQKNAYSAQIIKQLGFDPTMKPGQKRAEDLIVLQKLEVLTAVQSSRKEIELGPRPGQRIRSGVVVPANPPSSKTPAAPAELTYDLDDSDRELERQLGKPLNNMVDLDDSSDIEGLG